MEKSLAGYLSVITDVVLVSFEPLSPHNSQRIDGNQQHNEDNTNYHILTHAHTTKHHQTPPNTTPISRTDTGPLHSKWNEACTGVRGQMIFAWCEQFRQTGNAQSQALWHSGKSEPCVQREREPDRTSDHCHCC